MTITFGSNSIEKYICRIFSPLKKGENTKGVGKGNSMTTPYSGCTKSMEIFLERGKKMKHFDGLYVQRAEKKHTRYIEIDE